MHKYIQIMKRYDVASMAIIIVISMLSLLDKYSVSSLSKIYENIDNFSIYVWGINKILSIVQGAKIGIGLINYNIDNIFNSINEYIQGILATLEAYLFVSNTLKLSISFINYSIIGKAMFFIFIAHVISLVVFKRAIPFVVKVFFIFTFLRFFVAVPLALTAYTYENWLSEELAVYQNRLDNIKSKLSNTQLNAKTNRIEELKKRISSEKKELKKQKSDLKAIEDNINLLMIDINKIKEEIKKIKSNQSWSDYVNIMKDNPELSSLYNKLAEKEGKLEKIQDRKAYIHDKIESINDNIQDLSEEMSGKGMTISEIMSIGGAFFSGELLDFISYLPSHTINIISLYTMTIFIIPVFYVVLYIIMYIIIWRLVVSQSKLSNAKGSLTAR